MTQSTWYQKQFNMNFLKVSPLDILKILVYLSILNVIFLGLAYFTNTSRPIINTDYFVPLLLLAVNKSFIRFLGGVLLVICLIFDVLMLLVQIFPFLNPATISYFLPFVMKAPTTYLIGIIGLIVGIVMSLFLFSKAALKLNKVYLSVIAILFLAFSGHSIFLKLKYKEENSNNAPMSRYNYFYAKSQIYLYQEAVGNAFASWAEITPEVLPYPEELNRAVERIKTPYSNKVLFVIAESWGAMRTADKQQDILQEIYKQKEHFEFIEDGKFWFTGSTVQGEMRELCSLQVGNGYALRKLDDKIFANCLPNILKKQGYQTTALHGASGTLYDRYNWYGKAGFQTTWFDEHFPELTTCSAFSGVCDRDLFDAVGRYFAEHQQQKSFLYWLTLTSHATYSKKDIYNQRFDCVKHGMNDGGEVCRSTQMQVQFFDDLAKLVQRPEMKGVEVIVVGDHMPPFIGSENIQPHIVWQQVSWLHFKIKE